MKVKELERTVNVAWSPAAYHPILLAAGTAAQQLDASFNTTAQLELYSLNLAEPGLDLELKSSVASPNRFHKLVWGGSVEKEAGIVVGGCDSGKLQIYNVSKVLSGQDGLVSHQDRHTGSVRALDFNPFQTNLLASGASESEIFIWDLNNTSTPMTPGAKAQPYEDVMSLAWNRQVQHILASTFATRCTVWDLRKNEPIIKLTDSNSRVRWRVVCWNPDVATQLCLASEEDSNPVVQLWDLRFATTPLKSLHSHTRGVLSLAWCAQDSDLLISTGKDNRIICWNPNSNQQSGEIQCEIGNTQQWIFELAWCPRNPNLIASCSADSHASIYNLTGAPSSNTQTSNKILDSFPGMEKLSDESAVPVSQSTIELTRPPRWMRKPAGANFSFGGKLVGFGGDGSTVTVSQVQTDTEFVDRARNVLELIRTGRASELCLSRQDPVWSYIEATFSHQPYASIKQLLGYSQVVKPDIETISNDMATLGHDTPHSDNILDDTSNMVNGNDSMKQEQKKINSSFIIPTGSDAEGSICKSLLCGDIEEAVNRCLGEGRSSDALVLAMIAGSALLSKTQQKYFQSQNGSSHVEHLIRAIVTNDWDDFINNCNLMSWKEALVAVLTYARQDQVPSLCQILGRRLEETGEEGELAVGADVCYITSGSISSIINKKVSQSNLSSPQAMQELVELVMVGEASAMSQGKEITTDDLISNLFTDYALLIASQGDYQTAASYLQHTNGENVNDLRSRLDANTPNKQVQQGYQSQGYQQPRKFSSHSESGQFAKMTPIAAMRSNAAAAIQPSYPANDMRPPSHPPPSQSPSQHQGNVGKKYLVDPSVGGDSNQWGAKYYPSQPNRRISQEMTPFQPPGGQFQPSGGQFQPTGGQFQPPTGGFQPPSGAPFQPPGSAPAYQQPSIMNPLSPSSIPPPKTPVHSVQNYHTGKPGWNDPPVLTNSSKSQSKTVETAGEVKAPITSPLAPPPPDMYNQGMPGIPGGMPGPIPGGMSNRMPPTGAFQPPQSSRFAPPGPPPPMGAPNPSSGGLYGPPPMGSAPPTMGSAPPGPQQFSGPPMGSMPPMASGPPPMASAPPSIPSMGSMPSSMGPTQPPMSSMPPSMGSTQPPMASMPPPMGSTQPLMGSMPPSMGSAPPTMGSMPPSMGSAPPSMGSAPPTMGSAPPPMGMPSMGSTPSMTPLSTGPPQPRQTGSMTQPMSSQPLSSGMAPPQMGGPPPLGGQMGPNPGLPPMSSGLPPHAMQRPVSRQSQAPTPVPGIPAAGFHPPQSSSPAPQMNGGYGDPPTPRHVASTPTPVLPDNYKPLQSTLESLRTAAYNSSNNPQVKRKLEDVARKLECLYEALRECRLSTETISNLEELVRECKEGNYVGALSRHTQLISGSDFSQISPFMPSIKVLIQTAMQLNVYLQ